MDAVKLIKGDWKECGDLVKGNVAENGGGSINLESTRFMRTVSWGGPSPYASEMQGGDSRENGNPHHPVLWHSAARITGTSPSSSYPLLATTPGMGFPSFINMETPSPLRTAPPLGLDTLRPSTAPVAASYSSQDTHLFQYPLPVRSSSSLASGLKEPAFALPTASSADMASSGMPTRSDRELLISPASTMYRESSAAGSADRDHLGDQPFPVTSGVSPSTSLVVFNPPDVPSDPPTSVVVFNPSEGPADPPPVPENFPRVPVPQSGRGEGWPYAPQGWPKHEDKWGWRVGKRASGTFFWIDRYVSLPSSLVRGRRTIEFASRKSLVEYCKQNFPRMTDSFNIFKACDWKIPAPKSMEVLDNKRVGSGKREATGKRDKPTDGEDNWLMSKRQCRAGNPHCTLTKGKNNVSGSAESLVCHICCLEPDFCRECKCILCCKSFPPNIDDVVVVRCLNHPVPGQGLCGHAAHLECALNSQLAGVIKKNGLDLEYICRRCDRKTDLKGTVFQMVEAMGQNAPQSTAENVLQLALRTVQDPEDEPQSPARTWAALINDALKKIQEGAATLEIYKDLTMELNGLQPGQGVLVPNEAPDWSRATGRVRALVAPEHPNELTPAHFMPVSSLDPPTLPFQERPVTKQSEVPGNILSDVRMLPIVDMLNRLKASVHMPPTLAFKDHVKECQAMVERVRAAAYPLKPPHSSSTDKVSKSDKSKLASPSPVVKISSSISSGATTSRSVFSSQDGGAEEDAGSPQVEVPSVEPARDLAAGLKAKYEAKYEGQIREALEKLKRAQAEEYDRAEAALHVQKNLLIEEHSKLNQKLAVEHQVFAPRATDPPTKYVVSQLQKAHGEQIVFDSMLDISLGFGRVPKELLSKYFKWPPPATDQA